MNHNVPVFTLQEVASQLGMSPEMVLQYILGGKLRATKRRRPNGYGHLPEIDTYRCTQNEIDQFKGWLATSQQQDPIYSISDVAHMLKIEPQAVYQHICAGRLKAHKMRGPTITGSYRRVGAYRCSPSAVEELKTLLKACQGKKWYGSRKRASIAVKKEVEQNAHNLSIAQQLNGMLNNEKCKPSND